jgi:sporulation protein YlmC with PRC-barrel domain
MAGSGIRVFASGEILTAAQVNGYLMDQAVTRFADAATRDASFGGLGQPVLTEGRICYLDDVNLIQFFDGATWQDSAQFSIGDGLVTEAKLASNSVTSAKILDGTIVNADINASAAIDKTKISGTAVTLADTGVVTSTMIENDTIVNADIKSNAAIELGKLADSTIDTKTGNYTLVLTDKNKFIEMNVGSANTLSIPTDASVNFPIGSQVNITQYGTGKTQVVAVTPGTTSVRSTPGVFLRAQYSSATLIKRAANEWYLIGDLSAS